MPTGSHRKHAWAPEQAPARVSTRASTPAHCCTCQVPGRHVLHLSMSHTPVDAPPEFLRPKRSVAVPASPRARARMRQAQSSAHPGCHPCCHPCTLRGLAQSILGVRLIFLDEENRKEPLSKMSAEAQTPEQRISSSHKQLPEIGYDPCFRGAPCLDDRGLDRVSETLRRWLAFFLSYVVPRHRRRFVSYARLRRARDDLTMATNCLEPFTS